MIFSMMGFKSPSQTVIQNVENVYKEKVVTKLCRSVFKYYEYFSKFRNLRSLSEMIIFAAETPLSVREALWNIGLTITFQKIFLHK